MEGQSSQGRGYTTKGKKEKIVDCRSGNEGPSNDTKKKRKEGYGPSVWGSWKGELETHRVERVIKKS